MVSGVALAHGYTLPGILGYTFALVFALAYHENEKKKTAFTDGGEIDA